MCIGFFEEVSSKLNDNLKSRDKLLRKSETDKIRGRLDLLWGLFVSCLYDTAVSCEVIDCG